MALLAALLLAIPARADEEKKDKDKKKDAKAEAAQPQATGTSTEDLVREAEAKLAAGDAEAALELLRKASSQPPAHGERDSTGRPGRGRSRCASPSTRASARAGLLSNAVSRLTRPAAPCRAVTPSVRSARP